MRNTNPKTDKQRAKKWRCDERTIRNWRAKGAPLDDPQAMSEWLATRKTIPDGTATKVATEQNQIGQLDQFPRAQADAKLGAAATLQRLQAAEAEAHAAYTKALRSGNAIKTKTTRENWIEISETLRRYDGQVQEGRRITGEYLEKKEVERILKSIAHLWLMATHACAEKITALYQPVSGDAISVTAMACDLLNEGWITSLSAGLDTGSPGELPRWAFEALTDAPHFEGMAQSVDDMAEAFKGLLEIQLAHRVAWLAEEKAKALESERAWLGQLKTQPITVIGSEDQPATVAGSEDQPREKRGSTEAQA